MAKLNGKRIKVDGKKYEVRDHFVNGDENLETLILTRAIKSGKRKPAATINELGYTDENDIVYSDEAMVAMYSTIGKSFGKIINITMILNGGVLSDTDLQIVGTNWESPDQVDVIFLDKDSEKAVISKDLLLKSCLLWQERHGQFGPGKEPKRESESESESSSASASKKLGELMGMIDNMVQDLEDSKEKDAFEDRLGDILKNVFDEVDPRPNKNTDDMIGSDLLKYILDSKRLNHREVQDTPDMPDILKDILGSKRSEEFSIEEMNFDDAPQEIKDIIRKLKNRRR